MLGLGQGQVLPLGGVESSWREEKKNNFFMISKLRVLVERHI